jgi:putative aldouronate transport system permease protein
MNKMISSKTIKKSKSDNIVIIIIYSILTLCTIITLYPLVYVFSSSFSSTRAVIFGKVWLFPVEPNILGYKTLLKDPLIMTGYMNSIFYTVVGTVLNIVMTIIGGYPLSRKDFKGRSIIIKYFTFTMFFSGGMIPSYLLIQKLNLINSRWVLIIPGAMSVWNVIITRTFFQVTIPEELFEVAKIDGCSDIKFITRIVLPLSGAIISVMTLFYAVGHWNSYFSALLYLRDQRKYPLQLILRNILILSKISAEMKYIDVRTEERVQGLEDLLKYSLIVFASAPVFIIYPFVQKFFVKGLMIGSIKG